MPESMSEKGFWNVIDTGSGLNDSPITKAGYSKIEPMAQGQGGVRASAGPHGNSAESAERWAAGGK